MNAEKKTSHYLIIWNMYLKNVKVLGLLYNFNKNIYYNLIIILLLGKFDVKRSMLEIQKLTEERDFTKIQLNEQKKQMENLKAKLASEESKNIDNLSNLYNLKETIGIIEKLKEEIDNLKALIKELKLQNDGHIAENINLKEENDKLKTEIQLKIEKIQMYEIIADIQKVIGFGVEELKSQRDNLIAENIKLKLEIVGLNIRISEKSIEKEEQSLDKNNVEEEEKEKGEEKGEGEENEDEKEEEDDEKD